MRGEVTIWVSAPCERVWSLVTDVSRIGEFSPETVAAQWIDGSTAPAVGARFRGWVKRNGRGPTYSTICTVQVCEHEREFAFGVRARDGGRDLSVWRFRLRPESGGTRISESYELASTPALRLYWALAGHRRARFNQRSMAGTLERLKETAEAG